MPPKRGGKRKRTSASEGKNEERGDDAIAMPEPMTWTGWVEMESEPAFFNVMLKEMGVRGVKVQEVYGLDEAMLSILPQNTDQAQLPKGDRCPEHIWFANQVPDFACASVALLNIVNNVSSLEMGKELRDFRDLTADMDPLERGDAIDSFQFVKQIHNSFARDNDFLIADMHAKEKAAKAKKKHATAKAQATRRARKADQNPGKEEPQNVNESNHASKRACQEFAKSAEHTVTDLPEGLVSVASSPLSDPLSSESDLRMPKKSKNTPKAITSGPRRSGRKPQPRKSALVARASATAELDDEEGFHFIAYVPIEGHVWKLDGLDSLPQDLGTFDTSSGSDWMNIAQPALQTRMALYEGADIEFNLMAVVHDPLPEDRTKLLRNIKELQTIDDKLDTIFEDWRSLEGAETASDVIVSSSIAIEISQAGIDSVELTDSAKDKISSNDDLLMLVQARRKIICQQASLRAAVRDALESARDDDEKAKHRRHNYGGFVRSWLGALVSQDVLSSLLED